MKSRIDFAFLVALALVLAGCGGGTSEPAPSKSASAEPAPEVSAVESDLTRRWGPDTMPDQVTQPLEFLYWRVDRLYDDRDVDGDGRLTLEEFGGIEDNFERIDADADGFVIKKEIIDDMTLHMREQGTIP